MKIDDANKMIYLRLSRTTPNGFINSISEPAFIRPLIYEAVNALKCDFIGVNNILYDPFLKKILGCGGWTPERGLFYDMY